MIEIKQDLSNPAANRVSRAVRSFDGTDIWYDFYERPGDAVVVVLPGFWRTRRHASLTKLAEIITRRGRSVAVLDLRGHGESGGRFGFNRDEFRDVELVLADLERLRGKPSVRDPRTLTRRGGRRDTRRPQRSRHPRSRTGLTCCGFRQDPPPPEPSRAPAPPRLRPGVPLATIRLEIPPESEVRGSRRDARGVVRDVSDSRRQRLADPPRPLAGAEGVASGRLRASPDRTSGWLSRRPHILRRFRDESKRSWSGFSIHISRSGRLPESRFPHFFRPRSRPSGRVDRSRPEPAPRRGSAARASASSWRTRRFPIPPS